MADRADAHSSARWKTSTLPSAPRSLAVRPAAPAKSCSRTVRPWVSDLQRFVAASTRSGCASPHPPQAGLTHRWIKARSSTWPIGSASRSTARKACSAMGKSGFRAGDTLWDPVAREVTAIRFKPGQTTRYSVAGIPNATYGLWQLQRVGTETFPAGKMSFAGSRPAMSPCAAQSPKKRSDRTPCGVESMPAEADWTWEPRATLVKSTEGAQFARAYL